MHIASMTETRCLNLSSPQVVNFWETGPLTLGSRILLESHIKDIDPNRVVAEIFALIHQQPARTMVMERLGTDEVASYHPSLGGNLRADFTWSLVQAIYMGRSLPVLEDPELFLLLERLNELCDLALTQLEKIGKSLGPSTSSDLLARVEEMMSQLGLMDSRIQPLVAWVQAEQVRIGPDSVEHLVEKNLTIYRNLKLVLSQYIPESSPAQDESYPAPHA